MVWGSSRYSACFEKTPENFFSVVDCKYLIGYYIFSFGYLFKKADIMKKNKIDLADINVKMQIAFALIAIAFLLLYIAFVK